jgi:hypothetical protein
MTDDWSDEETEDPLVADVRNFYKVEKWTRDNTKVDSLLRQSAGRFCKSDKAQAADQADHPPANEGIR